MARPSKPFCIRLSAGESTPDLNGFSQFTAAASSAISDYPLMRIKNILVSPYLNVNMYTENDALLAVLSTINFKGTIIEGSKDIAINVQMGQSKQVFVNTLLSPTELGTISADLSFYTLGSRVLVAADYQVGIDVFVMGDYIDL